MDPPDQPSFVVDGNRLTLLDTGARRLAALIALIDGATSSLRVLYYSYAADRSGAAVRDALATAAKRGVNVSLIVDGFGSEGVADDAFFAPLKAVGVTICVFVPRLGRRYLLRNHQKLAVADEQRVIIGGFNVEDDYFGTAADQAWRDLGLLVEGPAAARIAPYFDALAAWTRNPRPRMRVLRRSLAEWREPPGPVRWLVGGPTRKLSPWARTVRGDMRKGSRIAIIAAYFAPSPTMLRRLDRAGRAGRDVSIVTAAKSDNTATIAAARFTYAGLLRKGVKVFEYQPTKLHTKLYVIDSIVHIGSANFDMRSLFLNMELMLRIDDAAFAAHLRAYVDGEIAQSEQITEAVYRKRTGVVQRIRQLFAYVLVAVIDPNVSRGLNFGIGN